MDYQNSRMNYEQPEKKKKIFTKKRIIISVVLLIIILLLGGGFWYAKNNKTIIGLKALNALTKVSQFLPIGNDEKKELDVVNKLTEALTTKDNVERTYMVFLQNNMELRPGGGFLGQYAIIKIKNGQVTSSFVEDANLLDQRITAKVIPPAPFIRMMQLKSWKFRDSNFSPDFPTNIEKAKYFYRLAGGGTADFDGFVAVNAQVFNDVLGLTGPITVPGYSATFNSQTGALDLEEYVEKQYIMDPKLDTQNRKAIMKKMAPVIIDKLFTLGNIAKIAELGHNELKNKNVMLNFKDSNLQSLVESVHWDGKVAADWGGDYLMVVDSNMGALKTDYYMKRSINYDVDLTTPKPTATVTITYQNTATHGDWRTSDYHSYLRVYTPKGSTFVDRKMIGYPTVTEEFNKTTFGMLAHTLINGQTVGILKYELPDSVDKNNYQLLIQKQSGTGSIPVKVHLKTANGEFDQEQTLNNDLKFKFETN